MILSGIIQARMSSSRLPGKVLKQTYGTCVLGHLLDRLKNSKNCTRFIVATSVDPTDDPVKNFCESRNVECFRGPLQDVAKRFLETIQAYSLDAFIRINADSPFMDPRVIDEAVDLFRTSGASIVTNTLKRSYPKGQSVEVLNAELFARHYPDMKSADEFEHVTQYFYKRPQQFNIHNFSTPQDCSQINLCVDTLEDFIFFETALSHFGNRSTEIAWQDAAALSRELKPS